MYLWTEFEGVTIDSAYSLTKLVQTEGRSAFFATRNALGESVLIRIIECHFDEDEIQARWRGLQTMSHPSFLRIEHFGKFYMAADDITAVYAVFERVDANLGEVLERGVLSATDAAQIGISVSSALETLHAAGFVHEHIETRNVFAVGDDVKLRSDCIRETPEGAAGIEARRRDVYDLAAMLKQVLLGTPRGSSGAGQAALPPPFDEIVRNGMNGTWGLAEIKAAFGRMNIPKSVTQKAKRQEAPIQRPAAPAPETLKPAISARQAAPPGAPSGNGDFSAKTFSSDRNSKPSVSRSRNFEGTAAKADTQSEQLAFSEFVAKKQVELPGQKSSMDLPVIFGISERDFRKWLVVGTLVLGAILTAWILLHHWLGHDRGSAEQAAGQAVAGQTTGAQTAVDNSHVAATPKTKSSPIGTQKAGGRRVEWRVVAFTYNRQDQAQKKVSSLAHQHPGLAPAVFSPTGKAPWLVTVGGVLERDAAYALARKARSLGLPHDTYAQDYTAR